MLNQIPNWHQLLIVMYHDRVLDCLLEILLAGFVLWGIYVWQGRAKLGVWGFFCWYPLLLPAAVGSALLLKRITGPVALPSIPTMYLFPVALLISVLTPPMFGRRAKYLVAHSLMAVGITVGFVWLLGLVIGPLLQAY